MVSLETSQIKQFTERFFHQSGFYKICLDTRYDMDEFFSLRLKIIVYGKNKRQKNQTPMNLFWRFTLQQLKP
ncbi:MAG: hypothetical protein HN417_08085 [Desulfobacula sp.]|jgi:hypothetical protein|nr:hypothetical protein [Desulfobacula sp.]MBT4027575.1 hypothetical protein [Desulfobacula sp.]